MKTMLVLALSAFAIAALVYLIRRQWRCSESPDNGSEAEQIRNAAARIRASRTAIKDAADAHPQPADGESPGPKRK